MLGLWHGKTLTDKDVLTLTQFISVLNYFAGVNLLVWLRKIYGGENQHHPVAEIVVHCYLYLVYILEVFNVLANKGWVIGVYLVFTTLIFAYHVNICHKFRRIVIQSDDECLPHLGKPRTDPSLHLSVIAVCCVWLLCVSGATLIMAAEARWNYATVRGNILEMLTSASSFNFVLKASFFTVTIESYFYVGFGVNLKTRTLENRPQTCLIVLSTTTKDYDDAISTTSRPRFLASLITFMVMLVIATFPDSLSVVLNTTLSKTSLSMTAAIVMQMAFIVDTSCYVAEYHVKRLLRRK